MIKLLFSMRLCLAIYLSSQAQDVLKKIYTTTSLKAIRLQILMAKSWLHLGNNWMNGCLHTTKTRSRQSSQSKYKTQIDLWSQ